MNAITKIGVVGGLLAALGCGYEPAAIDAEMFAKHNGWKNVEVTGSVKSSDECSPWKDATVYSIEGISPDGNCSAANVCCLVGSETPLAHSYVYCSWPGKVEYPTEMRRVSH